MNERLWPKLHSALALVAGVAAASGCGRGRLYFDEPYAPPLGCQIQVSPAQLDLGAVSPGTAAMGAVTVSAVGGSACTLSAIGLAADSDAAFTLSAGPAPEKAPVTALAPGESLQFNIAFEVANGDPPLVRNAVLAFASDDPRRAAVQVPIVARVLTDCRLAVSSHALHFGQSARGAISQQSVSLTATGSGACQIDNLAIDPGSDFEFSLAPNSPTAFLLAPGATQQVTVTFTASATQLPLERTGQLSFDSNGVGAPHPTVALDALLTLCQLSVAPANLDFGKVGLNTRTSAALQLTNGGNAACSISGLGFLPGSDAEFALPPGQVDNFGLEAGQVTTLQVFFTAADSAPPHDKFATLGLQSDDPANPTAQVALHALIDTPCTQAGQFIYTVDGQGTFSQFDPLTLTYTDITQLQCPGVGGSPFSMSIDQTGSAWVLFTGGGIFQVDTSTGNCQATSYVPGQMNFNTFGMGNVFDPATGTDTLYLATLNQLATLSIPQLLVSLVGSQGPDIVAELAGTGDGELWGFAPTSPSSVGLQGGPIIERYDPASGAILARFDLTPTGITAGSWAMKFFAGSFWLFVDADVWQVPRTTLVSSDPSPVLPTALPLHVISAAVDPLTGAPRTVVGAGVSSCAPLN